MLVFLMRRQVRAPIQDAAQAVVIDMQSDMPQRLDDFDAEGTAFGLVGRAQLARDAQIVLPAVDDGDDTAIDHIHVLIDAHGELQGRPALPVGGGEPQPVEEARVAGADMIEGGRKLVPDGIVEFGHHRINLSLPAGRAAMENGNLYARSRKNAIIRR